MAIRFGTPLELSIVRSQPNITIGMKSSLGDCDVPGSNLISVSISEGRGFEPHVGCLVQRRTDSFEDLARLAQSVEHQTLTHIFACQRAMMLRSAKDESPILWTRHEFWRLTIFDDFLGKLTG
jgi:hypothetical protein